MKFYSVLQTNSSLIEGRWQLIFTTRPGTASPIQVLIIFTQTLFQTHYSPKISMFVHELPYEKLRPHNDTIKLGVRMMLFNLIALLHNLFLGLIFLSFFLE